MLHAAWLRHPGGMFGPADDTQRVEVQGTWGTTEGCLQADRSESCLGWCGPDAP